MHLTIDMKIKMKEYVVLIKDKGMKLKKFTWEVDSFWARSSRKQHKPIERFHDCKDFLRCVEGDESQLIGSVVLPLIN